jgi:DNA-binding GntR family transcriptional regulator
MISGQPVIYFDYIDLIIMNQKVANSQEISAPEKAAAWIKSRLDSGLWAAGDNLPPLKKLAAQAGVSLQTMWKAVSILKREGVLESHQGRPVKITGHPEETSYAWKQIASQLTGTIIEGAIAPGEPIPSLAELQVRFNACYRTVKKALRFLEQKRIVMRNGKRFIVPAPSRIRTNSAILFINEGTGGANEGFNSMIRSTEEQSLKLGIRLVRYDHSYSQPFNSVEIRGAIIQGNPAGFLIDFWGFGTPEREKYFLDLMGMLYAAGKPVAIMDHVGDLQLPEPFRSSKRTLVVAIAGRVAGEDMARFLLGLGHTNIAYISPSFDENWSIRRHAGLQRILGSTGAGKSSITTISAAPALGVAPLVCAAAGIPLETMTALFYPSIGKERISELISQKESFKKQLGLSAKDREQIAYLAGTAIRLIGLDTSGIITSRLLNDILGIIGTPFHTHYHRRVFQALLDDSSITAWVSATDGIALAANTFLQENSTDIPGEISLTGFDNSLLATSANLTSYDFDIPGWINRALSFILERPGSVHAGAQPFEWPGRIFPRKSSGKVHLLIKHH